MYWYSCTISLLLLVCTAFAGNDNRYDYIVVGAGPSGSLAASELSKDSRNTVLLLEEGQFATFDPEIYHAQGWLEILHKPTVERFYKTIPQPGLYGKEADISRAMVTGGCGSHNAMIYILGNKFDYESWKEAGNPGWGWADIQPVWNEIDGKIPETELGENYPYYDIMKEVAMSFGYRYNPNPNNGVQVGVSPRRFMSTRMNSTYAKRMTAYDLFVGNVSGSRDNLEVLTYSRVNKVLFDNNKRAIGVEVFNRGTFKTVNFYAKKEVILSAGAIDSPKLLLLSGIGNRTELNQHRIPVVAEVPGVGQHLLNHMFFFHISAPFKNQSYPIPMDQFIYGDSGYLIIGPDEGRPEGNLPRMYSSLALEYNFLDGRLAFTSWVESQRPKSQGWVKLRSANPDDKPLIDAGFLSHPDDVKEIIWGVRQSRNFTNHPLLANLHTGAQNEIWPGWAYQTDAELEGVIRSWAQDDYHLAGSCKMGPSSDPLAVVDNRLRVRGVSKLRVIDASIMPKLISGNTNQISMIIGLKGARMVLADN